MSQGRVEHALELAYRYLGRRDRTVAEMRRHLEGRGIEPATVDAALDALTEQGHLDDARFAQRFAEDRRTLDQWGAERIERRLLALGVDDELVTASLASQGPQEELQAAIALLERRFSRPPSSDRDRNRALGLLVRRGYEIELAHDAIRARADSG